jgi:hypothetical protein
MAQPLVLNPALCECLPQGGNSREIPFWKTSRKALMQQKIDWTSIQPAITVTADDFKKENAWISVF